MIRIGDIDIDVPNRDKLLSNIQYIPAKLETGKKHNTGVYVQDVELDYETGFAAFDFNNEPDDVHKIDFLNFSALNKFVSNEQIIYLMDIEPDWSLLSNKEFVENTIHIHKWFDILQQYDIDSTDKLAMFLALIRPGKKHLHNKSWKDIEEEIWKENKHETYYFKKSHAYSYALTIVALMNLYSGY